MLVSIAMPLLGNATLEIPEPGDLPAGGRAWVLLALFSMLMGLLVALLVLTITRRVYRRYARGKKYPTTASHAQTSPWAEAGRRAAPVGARSAPTAPPTTGDGDPADDQGGEELS